MTTRIDVRLRDPETGGLVRVAPRLETDAKTARAVATMLRELWTQARYRELVKEIANGARDALAVYERYKASDLDQLAPLFEDRALEGLVDEYLARLDASESHKHRARQCFDALTGQSRRAVRLSDVPGLVQTYRKTCIEKETPRAFNYARSVTLRLLQETVGKRHPLYGRVQDAGKLKEAKDGVKGLSLEQALGIRAKLERLALHPHGRKEPDYRVGQAAARIWWAMVCTGMGATEFWGMWTVLQDRVRIVGTKREGRRWGGEGRDVPRVATPVRPEMTQDRFQKVLAKVDASPYQGRKTFAVWMEEAGIPRTRRKLYMGHAASDVTDLYERHDVTAFLAEDAGRLKQVLEPALAKAKALEAALA
jgi:hypothetical protein